MDNIPNVYVVRAHGGTFTEQFIENKCIAVGDNLSEEKISDEENPKKENIPSEYSIKSIKRLKIGDYVITPDNNNNLYWGTVIGDYYEEKAGYMGRHRRKIQWDPSKFTRTEFSEPFQNSIGSLHAIFRIDRMPRLTNHSEFFDKIGKISLSKKCKIHEEDFVLKERGIIIKRIEIENFRSLRKVDIALQKNYSLLVGNNDSGKSNILKALNLFFNGETDIGLKFNFKRDFSRNPINRKKKADEISIKLTLLPPIEYSDFQELKWMKVWRSDGEQKDKEIRNYANAKKGENFKSRSRMESWLKQIKYRYVPAMKGREYFQCLLSDLHDVLARDWEDIFKNDSKKLISSINSQTKKISEKIREDLDLNSVIQVPDDLKPLFASLDFETKRNLHTVSLSTRGDGVKVRHIPAILNYINMQDTKNNHETIWGYEEPENNLEMNQAFKSAEAFLNYSKNVQVVQTTHSPAFYSLRQKHKDKVELFYVNMTKESEETEAAPSPDNMNLDNSMGLLPFITPYIQKHIEEKEELEKSLLEKEKKILELNKSCIFVEGETDKKYIEKAIELFGKQEMRENIDIKFEKKGGAGWVADMIIAWAHSRKDIKSLGLLDDDRAGTEAYDRAIKTGKIITKNKVKLITLPNNHMPKLKDKPLPCCIEDLFPLDFLAKAQENGWLEQKANLDINVKDLHEISAKDFLEKKLDQNYLYAYGIKRENKEDFMNYVLGSNNPTHWELFKSLITDIESFFNE